MAKKNIQRTSRGRVSTEQAARDAKIRQQARQDFPPLTNTKTRLPTTGIAAQLRRARKSQGLTLDAVAKLAGIPDPDTVRQIEHGQRDPRLSNIEAVAKALGLQLELTAAQ